MQLLSVRNQCTQQSFSSATHMHMHLYMYVCVCVMFLKLIVTKNDKNHYCRAKLPANDLRNMLMILLKRIIIKQVHLRCVHLNDSQQLLMSRISMLMVMSQQLVNIIAHIFHLIHKRTLGVISMQSHCPAYLNSS